LIRALRSLRAWTRDGVRVSDLRSSQARGADAYGLAERLPPGPEREAAWAAYALQTYGDKLIDASVKSQLQSMRERLISSSSR